MLFSRVPACSIPAAEPTPRRTPEAVTPGARDPRALVLVLCAAFGAAAFFSGGFSAAGLRFRGAGDGGEVAGG